MLSVTNFALHFKVNMLSIVFFFMQQEVILRDLITSQDVLNFY